MVPGLQTKRAVSLQEPTRRASREPGMFAHHVNWIWILVLMLSAAFLFWACSPSRIRSNQPPGDPRGVWLSRMGGRRHRHGDPSPLRGLASIRYRNRAETVGPSALTDRAGLREDGRHDYSIAPQAG